MSIWDALISAEPSKPDADATATSMTGRIRHYLRSHPHKTAKQVADAIGITQAQSISALYYMETADMVISALDHSTERTRLTKHFSMR